MKKNTIHSKNDLDFKLAAVALVVLGLSAAVSQSYAIDAPVMPARQWHKWDGSGSCSNFPWGGSDFLVSELDAGGDAHGMVYTYGVNGDNSFNLYPGSIAGFELYNSVALCWRGFVAQPDGSLGWAGSDWKSLWAGSYDWAAITSFAFAAAYNTLGKTNMNAHGNDDDQWVTTYVNRTKDSIFLHYLTEQKWSRSAAPHDYEIPACSTYEMPPTSYTYNYDASADAYTGGWQGWSGDLTYGIGGAYTGRVHMIGNYPGFTLAANGQSLSGSSDAIWLDGLPLCKQGSDGQLEQSYGCVTSTFAPPKNVASSLYTGGHGYALRRYSGNVANENHAYVVFQPRTPTDTCPLDQTGLSAYFERHFPDVVTTHPEQFTLANHDNQTLKQVYPLISDKKMTGGLFITSWPTDANGFPKIDIDGNNEKITLPKDPVYGPTKVVASSKSVLKNPTGMIETLTSASFSRSTSTSTSATTTTGWSDSLGTGVTTSAKFNFKVAEIGVSISVNYNHTWSGSKSNTVTHSTTDTWSAPGQAISVPPHTEAEVNWVLKGGDMNGSFVFEGPIENKKVGFNAGGRLIGIPAEEINPGSYQAFDSDIVTIPNQIMYTDLFTLLRPAKDSAMPEGLSYDPKTDSLYLKGQGTFSANSAMELDMDVTMYKLDKNGDRLPNQHPTTTTIPVPPHVTPGT